MFAHVVDDVLKHGGIASAEVILASFYSSVLLNCFQSGEINITIIRIKLTYI